MKTLLLAMMRRTLQSSSSSSPHCATVWCDGLVEGLDGDNRLGNVLARDALVEGAERAQQREQVAARLVLHHQEEEVLRGWGWGEQLGPGGVTSR